MSHALQPPASAPLASGKLQLAARFDVLHVLGLAIAFFLLVGRWTPDRLSGSSASDGSYLSEPRFLVTVICTALAIGIACMRPDRTALRYASSLGSRLWFALFWGYLMVATIWASNYELAGSKAYELLLIAVLHFVILFTVRSRPRQNLVEGIILGLFVVALPMALMGVLNPSSVRTGGLLGGGPNVFGRQMLILTMSSAYFVMQPNRTKLIKTALLGIMIMATGLVVLSGSRGALLSQIVGIGTLLLFMRSSMSTRVAIVAFGTIGMIGVLVFTPIGASVIEMFETRVMKQTVQDGHMAGRETLYWSAIEIGCEKPVFGNGLNTYRDYFGIYPHNIFLELFSETGSVGVVLFLALVASSLRPAFRSYMELETSLFSLWLGLLAAANFSGDLFDSRLLFLALPLLARPRRIDATEAT